MAIGGARPGAGRPPGGISQTRRLLLQGLHRGFELAGRERGLTGEADEVVIESIARVASDLILAGAGRDALAILAQSAPKSDDYDDPGGERKSPLVQALERLPGLAPGSAQSQNYPQLAVTPENTEQQRGGATYTQSVAPPGQPFFSPQQRLLPPDLDAPGRECARDLARPQDASAPVGGGYPPPPRSASPPYTPGCTTNFEKNFPEKTGAK